VLKHGVSTHFPDEVEDRLNARMDEQFAEVNRRFDSQDTKLDIIIRGMTGMGQE
jgi:hypothetical protein